MPIFETQNLHKHYPASKRLTGSRAASVKALSAVDLEVQVEEALGIVGESGSGKSTFAKCLVRLERPTRGTIRYLGQDIFALRRRALRSFRRQVQLIFPDAEISLNPMLSIGEAIAEPMRVHGYAKRNEAKELACDLLTEVGLTPDLYHRLPRELSTGQCHRVVIARALSVKPKVIIADEILVSVDILTQIRLLDILQELKRKYRLTMIFISHDLNLVRHFCNRVVVMRRGRIVEQKPVHSFFNMPAHPYSRDLLAAANLLYP